MSEIKLSNNLLCFFCEKPLNFVRQIYEWDMYYGEDASFNIGGEIMINIFCDMCNKPRATVYIDGGGGIELSDEVQAKIAKDIEEIKQEKN